MFLVSGLRKLYREIKLQKWWYTRFSVLKLVVPKYYKAVDKKPLYRQIYEMLLCVLRYKCIPDQYFRYELYRNKYTKITEILNYVPDYVSSMRWFPIVNQHSKHHRIFLNNKIFFQRYVSHYGLPVPECLFFIINKTFYSPLMEIISPEKAVSIVQGCTSQRIFYKLDNSDGARNIHCAERNSKTHEYSIGNEILEKKHLVNLSEKGNYLFEKGVVQHPLLSKLHNNAVNSFRVVTQFKHNHGTKVLYCVLKMGRGDSIVDNLCRGAIMIGVDIETGNAQPVAYDRFANVYNEHPDSGVIFKGFNIPFIHEIVEVCIKGANLFPTLPSIGWDITYTLYSPVVIEGNDRWGLPIYQIPYGGMAEILQREWFPDESTKKYC